MQLLECTTEECSTYGVLQVDLTPRQWAPPLWDTVPAPAMEAGAAQTGRRRP